MAHVEVVGYRDWARDVFEGAIYRPESLNHLPMHFRTDTAFVCGDAELVFLVGWSALVAPEFYRGRTVLVVHPSRLPDYRGGSPIQHQIIDGLDESAVSIFRLDDEHPEVDSGPLCWQGAYSLQGSLAHVLGEIAKTTVVGIADILRAWPDLPYREQGPTRMPPYRRRTPADSEITRKELEGFTARTLYDKIRALQDPYPNAFITAYDGHRLYITEAHLQEGTDELAKDSRA